MKTILLIGLGLSLVTGCKHKAEVPAEPTISFGEKVQPVLLNNCAKSGCHDGNNEFSLSTYDDAMGIVKPGDAGNSRMYHSIISRSMPPDGPLTNEQTLLIYTWIMQGAKNN